MSNTIEIRHRQNILAVEDLRMVYRVGRVDVPALRGVEMRVKEAEFLAIMGPSGCGKSTLLHLLGGLIRPTTGRIRIDGVDISKVSDAQRTRIRRDKLGFVFQRFNLLPSLTARDNIDLARTIRRNGSSTQNGSDAERILDLLGLRNKMHHRPAELSGGNSSGLRLPEPSLTGPRFCSPTSPPVISIQRTL